MTEPFSGSELRSSMPSTPQRGFLSLLARAALPIGILADGIAAYLILSDEPEKPKSPPATPQAIRTRVKELQAGDYPVVIKTHGVVRSHDEVTLSAQVSGLIMHLSPSFEAGSYFNEGEILVELDSKDYRISTALEQARKEFVDPKTGESYIRNVSRVIGGYEPRSSFSKSSGSVSLEIMDPSERSEQGPRNSQIANRWTELIGPIPEATFFRVFAEQSFEGGQEYADANFHLELRGPSSPRKAEIAERMKSMLDGYGGIRTAWAQVNYGQDELEFSLKPRAVELGLNQYLLAQQIRQAFYGEEAQRVQRGSDDIRVMVRLPKADRETLHTLDQMKIRTPRGAEVPLATVAEVKFTKAPSFVERNDSAEVIRIGAQPINDSIDVIGIARELEPKLTQMCRESEGISFQFKGYVAEAEESKRRTILGTVALLIAIFALLAIPLKSLTQPILVMMIIPLGAIGALLGHIVMGMTPSFLSIFGMLALAGISVNNSLVMVDYVNQRRAEGITLLQAAMESGARRFQPIVLTSVTTFVGLAPMIFDRSLEAQFLIPMAVSMGFGILFTTVITLYLVPCTLIFADDVGKHWAGFLAWYFRPFRASSTATTTRPDATTS